MTTYKYTWVQVTVLAEQKRWENFDQKSNKIGAKYKKEENDRPRLKYKNSISMIK